MQERAAKSVQVIGLTLLLSFGASNLLERVLWAGQSLTLVKAMTIDGLRIVTLVSLIVLLIQLLRKRRVDGRSGTKS